MLLVLLPAVPQSNVDQGGVRECRLQAPRVQFSSKGSPPPIELSQIVRRYFRFLSQKATPSLGCTIAEPEWYKNAGNSPPLSTTTSTKHPIVAAPVPVDKPPRSTTMSPGPPIPPPPAQISGSSPVRKGAFYAPHKLEQVQRCGYRKETHRKADFENAGALFKFLGTPKFDKLPVREFNAEDRKDNFFETVNTMSEAVRKRYFKPLSKVVFKDTESKVPRGHVTDTECRPDITAAFEGDFSDNDTTFWPCIRMAGEWASKGMSSEAQETKAISYLHYLLLARPDLYVAQGMLASEDGIMFLVGIGGFGIRRFKLGWDDDDLSKLLYAFIYRTYNPGDFADSSYKLDPNVDETGGRTWTITIGVKSQVGGVTTERQVPCPNLLPLYASSPFETRTHVFAAKGEGVDVDRKKLKVLKDQVCRTANRFKEHQILKLVHEPKRVPGVVEAVYHKEIKLPSQLEALQIEKTKHRHGLGQLGSPFASIPTVKEMLQVAFDIVEVLRFLKTKRDILHRDISVGNVLYAYPSEDEQDPGASTQDNEGPIFSEYFLSKGSRRPRTTSVLLVDFNHAEHLTSSGDSKRVERTGTAVFMARAVELGDPVPLPRHPRDRYLAPMPSAPGQYEEHYRNSRLKKFPPQPTEDFTEVEGEDEDRAEWRHELDHDIESVFWLMLYWAMTAQPKGGAAEHIATMAWSGLMGNVKGRQWLLQGLYRQDTADGTFHSTFQPLSDLFEQLAGVLYSVDRYWLPASETRNDPEYFAEAFQRLILQYLIDHKNDDSKSFMNQAIDSKPRKREREDTEVPNSTTSNQRSHASSKGTRASNTNEQAEP